MKHIYFVRHGLSEANEAGVWSGQRQTPLSDGGRAQAHEAGEAAKNLGIDMLITSPYERTVDTAKIIADAIGLPHDKIIQNKLFIERGLGELEGKPWKIEHSIDDYEGVEARSSLFARMKYAYDYLESLPADTILVVGHGASGRALRHVINPDIPFQGPGAKRMPNGQIVKLL